MEKTLKIASLCAATILSLEVAPHATATEENSAKTASENEHLIPIKGHGAKLKLQPVHQYENVKIKNVAGGQQAIITLNSEHSPRKYEFDLGLGSNEIVKMVNGNLFIERDGQKVARISSPWAHDSNGRSVKTYFKTNGKTISQYIVPDSKTEYPVTADPRWDGGNISGHIYFSKEETRKVAAGSASLAAVGPFWLAVPPPAGPAIAGWWEKNSIDATVEATGAVRAGTCLQLKVGYIGIGGGVIGVDPDTYSDGCS